MSLEVRNLRVETSSGKVLLDDVNWRVDAGGRMGIIGESGSGKSLTAAAILGLLPDGMRTSGQILLDGQDLLPLPEHALRQVRGARIGMIFQEPLTALDPLMRVERQIVGPLRMHRRVSPKQARALARDLMDMVRLDDAARILASYPWQLSGGQRQRVSIAMALGARPDVLIADEPTTALDVTVQAEILDLLDGLIEQTGTTLVFVTHDLPVVARVARQLVVMRAGGVVENTTITEAVRGASEPYTRQLLAAARAAMPEPGAHGEALGGGPDG